MFFIVIVVVAVAAFGALLHQQQVKKQGQPTNANASAGGDGENSEAAGVEYRVEIQDDPEINLEHVDNTSGVNLEGDGIAPAASAEPAEPVMVAERSGAGGLPQTQEEIYTPVLSAKPISSPNALSSATYTSKAPASSGADSPYAYGNKDTEKKAKPTKALLRWCGRTGSLQAGMFLMLGPIAYWSEGETTLSEPSCIDLSLPVEAPSRVNPDDVKNIAASYKDMTPAQRGLYLTWLAGGRIQPAIHQSFPTLWLYGLERRVIVDRLDLGLCFSEAFKLLPLIRWDALLGNLIKFITWLAIKIWMPEDELLAFCKRLQMVPESLLGLLLGPYANAKLSLPAATAFTLMRTSKKLRDAALKPLISEFPDVMTMAQRMVHSDELQQKFAPMYRNACNGGIKLTKPQATSRLTYTPMNPMLSGSGGAGSVKVKAEAIEIPDFFDNLEPLEPLLAVWRDFIASLMPSKQKPETAAEQVENRPDFAGFIENIQVQATNAGAAPALANDIGAEMGGAFVSTLADIAGLMGINHTAEEKLHGRDRKSIIDMARVEGYLVLPNLGLSGRDYFWTDKILLLHLDLGEKLSLDYNTASFLLEFCCSLLDLKDTRLFEPLRQRMNDYFTLTTEDNLRLDAQQLINLPAAHPKEFYSDFLQFILQEPERCELRNFLLHFLGFIPDAQLTRGTLLKLVCDVLSVAPEMPPPMGEESSMKRGQSVIKLFSSLFKDA